MGRRLNTAAA